MFWGKPACFRTIGIFRKVSLMINKITKWMISTTQHYNHKKYWKMRTAIQSREKALFVRVYYLYLIKKMDAFNGASFGTHIDKSAFFETPPRLPHGIRGIFISHNAVIGRDSTIFHQVTIGEGKDGAPTIGDNCYIGAGAKIIGKISIGDNVRIGANCIVCEDIPDNCTVVMEKPRIICRPK